ncbi:MAG: branched-chain amino acid ABC transporter permease [Desulfobacterales bacterium]|nr:branched-chain amino acid ABC transporter permease [Desulfobacterales bacterium]
MQVFISTVVVGTIYAVLALGFSLIWGAARIVNLAYTSFYMLAAYFFYVSCSIIHLNIYVSAVLSIVVATLIGVGTYKIILEPVRSHETVVILISICSAFFFEECILSIFGTDFRRVPPFILGYQELWGVRVLNQHFLAFGVSIALILGLWLFLSRARTGIAIRATSQDREIVNVMGIDEKKVSLIAMFIGIGFVTISSIVVSPIYVVEPLMWVHPIIMVLAINVLGGLGSLKGSFIAAYLLAFCEVAVVNWFPMGAFVKSSIALLVMVIVLSKKPEGMFGAFFEEERL